ncbi:glycosyltransferase [Paucisalibacillus globulus]|uniref:glycosyltransferase n=1 Tax=Paucisalibacillus globulus TaxID=351095 RepID=UPI000BB93D1B|nr:glycosyltransferase [Paucisalibacillus globulus]
MDKSRIDKRLKEIQRSQRQLANEILKEKDLLDKLVKRDLTWNYFLRQLQNSNSNNTNQSISDKKRYLLLKEELCDYGFFQNIKGKLDSIPNSNGSRYFGKVEKEVAIISDEFLFNAFSGITNLHYITPENYSDYSNNTDVLIIASTWKGLQNEWRGLGTVNSSKREILDRVIQEFRKNNIPVVFYNKEDPVNFDRFIGIAQKCDYIFTTAEEKIPQYKKECGHANVHLIEFSANPLYHNPIGMNLFEKNNDALFAGSWYSKYPHRQKDTQMIFDGIIESGNGLKILDRNFNLNIPEYYFPEQYLKYISPAVPHNYVQKLHKLYNWAINLNSVITSPTMIANRVFELQALGNIIISNYSPAINNKFQNVFTVTNKFEVGEILNSGTAEERYNHQVHGIRQIMNHETSYHRLQYIFNIIGLNYEIPERNVLVVVDEINEIVADSFSKQAMSNKNIVSKNDFTEDTLSKFDFVTFFSDKTRYHHYYLNDLINGFKYTDSDYVSKGKDINSDSFNYQDKVENKYNTMFWTNSYSYNDFISNQLDNGKNGFVVDHFEYDEQQGNESIVLQSEEEYKLSVIVPVYNNGVYLENKCFKSLKRSSVFNKMEIILVDDGSTSEETKIILERLNSNYNNVKLYQYDDNGSGSASRPRNKGIELATGQYITYLDPDNEAINDGYALLLNELENDSTLDLAVGNIIRLDNKNTRLNYYYYAYKWSKSDIIDDPKQLLLNTALRAQSIQALLVKKDLILRHNLKMVENAAGQDTLFFQELLINSNKIKIMDLDIHIYYADVSNSVTNTISKRFFEKYLKLERARYEFLNNNDILNLYMKDRFNYYFKNWYFKRVPLIEESSLKESLGLLLDIYKIYEPYLVDKSKEIEKFVVCMNKEEYIEFRTYCEELFAD